MFSLVLSKFLAMRNITSYTAVYLAGVSKSVHWLIDYDKLLIKRGHRNSFIYPLFIHLRNPEGSSTTLFCKHFNSQTYVKSRIMDGALRIQIYHSQSWMACFSQKLVNATTTIVDREYLLTQVLTPEYLFFGTFWHSSLLKFDWSLINHTRASRVLNS